MDYKIKINHGRGGALLAGLPKLEGWTQRCWGGCSQDFVNLVSVSSGSLNSLLVPISPLQSLLYLFAINTKSEKEQNPT